MADIFGQIGQTIPQRAPEADGFAVGFVTALAPLTVTVGEQTYLDDEIILARQLTERTEEVTPVGWQTETQTCTAAHRHSIPQDRVQLTIHSPLKVGQRLLILPRLDQQTIYAVDILP